MVEMLVSYDFWLGLAKIIGVNIVLSGDNAVVIALAALIGMVAGEMLVTDIALKDWQSAAGIAFDGEGKPRIGGVSLELAAGAIGAAFVVIYGKWSARRAEGRRTETENAEA